MVQVILGRKGSGKTKRLIDLANEALKTENGYVVFVDDDNRYMYDLRHEVRFVDLSEYAAREERSAGMFYGLISGMLSVNYDISLIFVDAFKKLVNVPAEKLGELKELFDHLNVLSENHQCKIVLSISADPEELPDFITALAI